MTKRALSVELLLQWAYAEQRVRGMPTRPIDDDGGYGDGELLERPAVRDDSALDFETAGLSDARRLDLFVSRLSKMTRHLVRDHAIARTRPDWREDARYRLAPLHWYEVRTDDGIERLAVFLDTHPAACRCKGFAHVCTAPPSQVPAWKRGERVAFTGNAEPPTYCPIVERDKPDDVWALREQRYLRWWAGLQVIRDYVQSGALTLDDHNVTEALPPRNPKRAKILVDEALASR